MALDAKTKQLLNDFSKSQIALNDISKPAATSGIQLGDLIDEAMNAQIEADLSDKADKPTTITVLGALAAVGTTDGTLTDAALATDVDDRISDLQSKLDDLIAALNA